MALALVCATGLALFMAIAILSADKRDSGGSVYSPYPAGLIPKDLQAETDRVNREIEGLETELRACTIADFRCFYQSPPRLRSRNSRPALTIGRPS